MSNANRDYAIVYDIKNSLLVLSRPLNFYITDKNTSNIFVRLVTRVIVGNGIDQYTDIENASSYVLTMRVIKPDDEVKSIIATQHESESIFQFDLTEDFKDVPGKYMCELTISNIVNGRQEFTTSDPFNYEVKRSILSNVKNIIEGKDTTVEKLLNNLYAAKAEMSSQTTYLQQQINNLVLGATGDGNNAEVIQARGEFDVLNSRLNAITKSIGFDDEELLLSDFITKDYAIWSNSDNKPTLIGYDVIDQNNNYLKAVPYLFKLTPGDTIIMSAVCLPYTYFLDESYQIINSIGALANEVQLREENKKITFVCPENAMYLQVTLYSDIVNEFFSIKDYTSSKINEIKDRIFLPYNLHSLRIHEYSKYVYSEGKGVSLQQSHEYFAENYKLAAELIEVSGKSFIQTVGISMEESFILDENMNPLSTTGFRNGNEVLFNFVDDSKKVSFMCPENAKYLALTYFSDNDEFYVKEWDGDFRHIKENTQATIIQNQSTNNLSTNNLYEKYRFLMTSFNYNDMKLSLLGSNDGVNYEVIGDNIYTPQLGRGTLRDPSITRIGDYYYITYTVIDWTHDNKIGMCRTKDFNSFEELPQLAVGEFDVVWAPEFFIDGFDTYIVFSGNYQAYYTKYNHETHSVGEILKLNVVGHDNYIDTSLLRKNGKYYAFCKNETTKYLFVACADSLDGEFNVIYDDSLDSKFGHPVEGQMCIRLDNGKIRMYYEDITVTGQGGFYYNDTISDTIESGWTERKRVNINNSYNHSHPFVIDLYKGNCTDI